MHVRGVKRVDRALGDSDEPRHWRRLGLVLAGAASVCALVFGMVHMAPMSPPSGGQDSVGSAAPVSTSEKAPEDTEMLEPFSSGWLADTTPPEQSVLARPLPRKPFKGQKRPPCIRYTEVELVGACWAPHKLKAPCPDSLYEYQGECYLPSFSAQPPPQSLEP
ncbi:hypothetical protein ACN28E_54760 [Archangium lansingense]|uniref:hypothetical protein n=1 Tax=Archangium lansingense TaxID=2995310 RepID=UPI003B7765CC